MLTFGQVQKAKKMERGAGFLLNAGSSGGTRKLYPNRVSLWQRKEGSRTVYASGLRNGAQSGVWVLGDTKRGGKDVGASPVFEAPQSLGEELRDLDSGASRRQSSDCLSKSIRRVFCVVMYLQLTVPTHPSHRSRFHFID